MAKSLQPVRGTHDILPDEMRQRRWMIEQFFTRAQHYGFEEIATPIFEFSEVFHRTLGDSSDVVSKETYSFEDRGGESLTLRPEFTASMVRAFLSNGMQQNLPCRFFYTGPAFRYERPQKGRMRQFHQLGIETLGVADPLADIESIALAHDALTALGLGDSVTLELNSLGDAESRVNYRESLVAYLQKFEPELSADSKIRLRSNPLRILDSKDDKDRAIIADAPKMQDYFTDEATEFFAAVTAGLDALGITYTLNPKLVRGLDYYSHTVFEFTSSKLGAQSTLLAGGRYDGLVELMGGQPTAGVGWAAGIERLLIAVEAQAPKPARPVAILPMDEASQAHAMKLAHTLRKAEISVTLEAKGNFSKRMKKANQAGAQAAIIFGQAEYEAGKVQLKWLDSGKQSEVTLDSLANSLNNSSLRA